MIKAYRSLVYNLKNGGIPEVLDRIIKKIKQIFFYKSSWLVYSSELDALDVIEDRDGLRIESMSFQELVSFKYFKAIFYPESIKRRLAKNEVCYGFFSGNNLEHIAWVTAGYLFIEKGIPNLEDKTCGGIYDCITFPEYRNKGIYKYVLKKLQKILKESGKTKALITVDADNIYSKKAIESVGFQMSKKLTFSKILFFRKVLYE